MDRRSRGVGVRLRAFALALILTGLAAPAGASGQVPSDLVDWNLTESTSTWPSQYHTSSGWTLIEYRWLDTPAKATVISANNCSSLGLYGSATIPVNDTGYKSLYSLPSGTCFVLRGRTTSGSGSMVNHDGRVRR